MGLRRNRNPTGFKTGTGLFNSANVPDNTGAAGRGPASSREPKGRQDEVAGARNRQSKPNRVLDSPNSRRTRRSLVREPYPSRHILAAAADQVPRSRCRSTRNVVRRMRYPIQACPEEWSMEAFCEASRFLLWLVGGA